MSLLNATIHFLHFCEVLHTRARKNPELCTPRGHENCTCIFPTWIPGTRAAPFHGEQKVTKGIPAYIRDADHTPAMKEYLIRRSNEATGRDKSWDEVTYESD
jgi:hypothetical protein